MDELSKAINIRVLGVLRNYLYISFVFADDLCLISLSSSESEMQQLLNICQIYAIKHQLLHN